MRLVDTDKLPVKRINIGGPIIAELGTSTIGGPMSPRWINVVYADDIAAAPTITPESLAGQEQQSGCCKFCNTAHDDWSYDGVHVLRLNGNGLFYFDHVFGWEGIGIKFCPMCGRELDSEE